MWFEIPRVEALAPDQAALKAARGLTKLTLWPVLGSQALILWGECQGSGANPYQVGVDARDMGYRCTCPSRKAPCKHVLALMLIAATDASAIVPCAAPEWVGEWLGRRRPSQGRQAPKPATTSQRPMPSARPGLGGAPQPTATRPLTDVSGPADRLIASEHFPPGGEIALFSAEAPQDDVRSQARRAATEASIAAGLDELEDWISDQLRAGLTRLVAEAPQRCRRIAARLVDHKAGSLASRVDEMPARLFALPSAERARQAVRELGKLVLLAQAWRADPTAPHIRRAVGVAEQRAAVLADPRALRTTSVWEVAGSRVTTRRDRLISHATWLINLGEGPPCALLQDYYPVTAPRAPAQMPAGRQIAAELVYYPGGPPVRAVIATQEPVRERLAWPAPAPGGTEFDPLAACRQLWDAAPWELEAPALLGPGGIVQGGGVQLWWGGGAVALPLARPCPVALLGSRLEAFGIWDGARLDLLAAQSEFGPVTM
ncbi:MAG: SWIM zinc finger domain-containing protein [Bifidobacteriaceae bacterium]|jgi:hypothetical protein|nr:SWIM zinc finger domain-containing protein [Bifidobacteriaceae bacterium]